MTETFNKTRFYKADHTQSGGIIEPEDFNTDFPNKKRITNQIEAINKSSQRKEEEKYRHMTIEELKEMEIISKTNERPSSTLTDEKWQKEFSVRKLFITQHSTKNKLLKGQYSQETGKWNEETQGTYHGQTNWQSYCSFINDILRNIRAGQVDYCYYIYQIMDLAKFHFHDLKTRYCNGYWEVWLDKK